MRLSEYEIRRIRHMRRNGVPLLRISALTGRDLHLIIKYGGPTPNHSIFARHGHSSHLLSPDAALVAEAAFRAERERMEVSHR